MSVRKVEYRNPKTGAEQEHWLVDFTFQHANGRRQRVKKVCQTRKEAEFRERKLHAELLNPTPKVKEVPTFADFVKDRWWPTYPSSAGNRHTTIREKEWHLRLHLTPTFGKLRLDEIRKESIDRFYAKLSRDGLREKTRKNIGGTLRRILASAVEWEIIAAVPAFPKVKVPDGKSDFFNGEESSLAIKAARNIEERALLLFAFRTGARAGEQIALEWGDIDWTNQKIIIRRSSSSGIVGPTKSGKDRKVPMTSELEAVLRQLKHVRGPRVFCNPDGKPMSIYQLHERLLGACRRAGLRKIRWHDCRHSFASQLVMSGAPLRQVQEWLGHSTIQMTMRYSHLSPGGGREFMAALDAPRPFQGHSATG